MNERIAIDAAATPKSRVVHLVASAGAADRLWGKENVIVSLMEAQRASGTLEPELVTFTPGLLDGKMRAAGFKVSALEAAHRRLPTRSVPSLRHILADGPPAIVHTHEYKANLVGRLARASGAPMRKLVATCHGWVDRSPQLDVYFSIDRLTSFLSDVVTVTDPQMCAKFRLFRPHRLVFVQNAVAARPEFTQAERSAARTSFGFSKTSLVIGSLGRLTKNKGVLDILTAARRTLDTDIIWAVAGSGVLTDDVASCDLPNVRYVGYQADSASYLAALDVYLQASYFEGLSLSLLESMRAGLPSIATNAGATSHAVTNRCQTLIIDAGDIDALVAAARELHADALLRATLGQASRARFDEAFTIERQHAAFADLYLS